MLNRKIQSDIENYLSSNSHKMLLVDGARQVGKSFIIRYVGQKRFANYIEVNMESDKQNDRLFADATSVDKFYLALSAFGGDLMGNKDDTLVFIDEVQAYDRSASDSIVKIFPNYMQFYNPGSLPDTISIEQLMNNQYVSTPRNRQIARVFKELGEIEKYGTGIRRVCAMCETYGCKRPKWEAISDGVRVTLYGLGFDELGKDDEKLGENDGMLGKKLGKDDGMLGNELGEKRMEILKAIADDSKISTKQLAERFGMSSSAMDRHLKYLKDNGFLRHVGPKNGGHWQVVESNNNSNKEK